MKGDLKKILSIIWKGRKLKIGYIKGFINVVVDNQKFNNQSAEWNVDSISVALSESPVRATKEARALSETIKILDDLTELGYFTSMTYIKRDALIITIEDDGNRWTWEVLDVDKHNYSSFVRKLVDINKKMKKIV